MQNLGIDGDRLQKLSAVEQEIAAERAGALGITGRRLEAALRDYREQFPGAPAAKRLEALARIADALQELLIQREALGLPEGNVEWVLQTYGVPQEVVSRLGLR